MNELFEKKREKKMLEEGKQRKIKRETGLEIEK